jgi:hypothetical protein
MSAQGLDQDTNTAKSVERLREDRLQYLEDRAAIQDLASCYAVSCDTSQLEATVNCWAPEGVFDETAGGYGRYVGHGEIRDFFRDVVFASFKVCAHLTSNHHISEIARDTAAGVAFVAVDAIALDGSRMRVLGCYHDKYTKTPNGWKFQTRAFVATFPRDIVPAPS